MRGESGMFGCNLYILDNTYETLQPLGKRQQFCNKIHQFYQPHFLFMNFE